MNSDEERPGDELADLFNEALEAPPGRRTRLMSSLRASDPRRADELESLLEAAARPQPLLDAPLEIPIPESTAPQDLEGVALEGLELGPCIGEGGMGRVYEAWQLQPRRRVAVKVLSGGGEHLGPRLSLEAQALARLDHPSVAKVLGAGRGEVEGRPVAWMAVEFIEDATPLTDHAQRAGLDRAERVALLLEAVRAIEHAHGKGVLHRDLKPQNLLVDGTSGRVKVIDFGLARLSDPVHDEERGRTLHGEVLGTLAYMSPEQAAGRHRDVDVRTDVYALGAVLFELLTGAPLHDLEGATILESLAAIQAGRVRSARTLDGSIDADLDSVVSKAVAADPEERYGSAGALAEDLRRWLAGHPVVARRPSAVHRLRLFARRRKGAFTAAAVAAVLLVVGLGIITRLSMDNARKLGEIERRGLAIEAAREELSSVSAAVTRIVERDTASIVDRATAADADAESKIEKRAAARSALADLERLRDLLGTDRTSLRALATAFGRIGDLRWTGWTMDTADADMLWDAKVQAAALWRRALLEDPEDAEATRELVETLTAIANAARGRKRHEEGIPFADEAVMIARRARTAKDAEDAASTLRLIEALFARSDLMIPRASAPQALVDSREALDLARTLPRDDEPGAARQAREEAWALLRIGFWVAREEGDTKAGVRAHSQARETWETSLERTPGRRADEEMYWTVFLWNEIDARCAEGDLEGAAAAFDGARPRLRFYEEHPRSAAAVAALTAMAAVSLDHLPDPEGRRDVEERLGAVWERGVDDEAVEYLGYFVGQLVTPGPLGTALLDGLRGQDPEDS